MARKMICMICMTCGVAVTAMNTDTSQPHTHTIGPCGHAVTCEQFHGMKVQMARQAGWLPDGQTLAYKPWCVTPNPRQRQTR